MNFDTAFTNKLRNYLKLDPEDRDIMKGATMLLQINRNKFLYKSITNNPERFKAKLFYELEKQLKYRSANETEDAIAKKEEVVEKQIAPVIENHTAKFIGKREDHDNLPDEIKALYTENASLLQRMRDLHTKLRLKSDDKKYKPCDRFDDLTILIELNEKYRDNWERYDNAQIVEGSVKSEKDHATDKKILNSDRVENKTKKTTAKGKKNVVRSKQGKK